MNISIQPIGSVLPVDENGFLVSVSSPDNIKPPWTEAVEFAKSAYLENLGDKAHSIYIRGSVAKGTAIEGISDLDTLAVVIGDGQFDLSWADESNRTSEQRFSFCEKIEFGTVPFGLLMDLEDKEYQWERMIIKTQVACVYGINLASKLPKVKPGKDIMAHVYEIARNLVATKVRLQSEVTDADIARECVWLMKRLLRTGFELVMERERVYTRDLYPSYKLFSMHYPDKERAMRTVLELALNPTSDSRVILQIVDNFGAWMVGEAARFFSV